MKYYILALTFMVYVMHADIASSQTRKSIFDFLRFKHNAQLRRDTLVGLVADSFSTVENMPVKKHFSDLKDSIRAIQAEAAAPVNLQVNNLAKKIDAIFAKDSLAKHSLDSLYLAEKSKQDAAGENSIAERDGDENSALADVLEKIYNDTAAQNKKYTAIALIRENLISPGAATVKQVNDTVVRTYKSRVVKKTALMAFCKVGGMGFSGLYLDILDGIYYDAFKVDGSTGKIKGAIGWNFDTAYKTAKYAHKKVVFTIREKDAGDFKWLVYNGDALQNFISQLAVLIKENYCTGINLWVDNLKQGDIDDLTQLAAAVRNAVLISNKNNELDITISPQAKEPFINYAQLCQQADRLIVDFRAPLNPDLYKSIPLSIDENKASSISSCISRYLQQKIDASKFILLFSYRGTSLCFKALKKDTTVTIGDDVPYRKIQLVYTKQPLYCYGYTNAYFDTLKNPGPHQQIVRTLYDDENTLSLKYDYVLNAKLGGVAIWQMGDDDGYGSLSDLMMYKFLAVQTDSADSVTPLIKYGFWQSLKNQLLLYYYVLNNPCLSCFNNNGSISLKSKILGLSYSTCVKRLRLFWEVVLGVFTLLLGTLFFVYYSNVRLNEAWKAKRKVIFSAVAAFIIALVSAFSLLYLGNNLSYFTNAKSFIKGCLVYTGCTNIPYPILLLIILAVCALVLVCIKFFTPLLKGDDEP
jgi:hypothetical protein